MKTVKKFEPLKVEDFNLTPKEMALLVKGAQKFLPPTDDSGEPLDKRPELRTSK